MAVIYIPRPPNEYYWYGRPTPPSRVLLQALADNVPFRPALWDQNYDDAGVWQVKPYPIPTIQLPGAFAPIQPRFWRYNNDDSAYWVRNSYPVPPVRMPVGGGFPFKPRQWKRDYDETSIWNRSSYQLSFVLRPQATTQPFQPRLWFNDFDDTPNWQHIVKLKQTPTFGEYCQGYIIGN